MKKMNSKTRRTNRQKYLSIALLPFLVYSTAAKAIVKLKRKIFSGLLKILLF